MTELSARDRVTLEIADAFGVGRASGPRESHVRVALEESETRWAQRLRRLVWESPEAEAAYPVLVHRLRRQMPRGRVRHWVSPNGVDHVVIGGSCATCGRTHDRQAVECRNCGGTGYGVDPGPCRACDGSGRDYSA